MKPNYTSIRLEVTSGCNLNCAYCHNAMHSNQKDDLTTEELITLIQNLKHQYNIKKILLTGGEPLVKKDICKIIEVITELGIKADMVTNGTLLSSESIKNLEKAGLKRIRISIDEVSATTEIRGNSKPNDIWKKAQMVVEKSNIELCIHTVCSPFNVHSLYDVYLKTLEIGAKRWRVFDLGYQGDFVGNSKQFSLESYYQDLISSTQTILTHYLSNDLKDRLDIEINNVFRTQFLDMKTNDFVSFDPRKALTVRLEQSPCDYVTSHQLSIRNNGYGTLCQYFHNPIYDFKKASLDVSKALDSLIPFEEFTLAMKDLPYCSKCKYCMLCNSGCRARAHFLTGDIKEADPVACFLHPLVHHKVMSMLPDHVQEIYNGFVLTAGHEPKYSFDDLKGFLRKKGYGA